MCNKKQPCYIEVLGTAVLLPFNKREDVYVLLDDFYMKNTGCYLLFHNIRQYVDNVITEYKLDLIYDYIAEKFHIDKKICMKIKEYEIRLWRKYLQRRNAFYKKYETIISDQFEVLFCNNVKIDDYLLKEILVSKGYIGDVVSVYSSDNVISWAKPNCIFKGDVNPLVRCLDVEYVASGNLIFPSTSFELSIGYGALRCIVANKFFDDINFTWKDRSVLNENAYNLGYYLVGMHLAGIIKWISGLLSEKDYDHILFSARDGYLVMNAYNIYRTIHPELPEAKYIQGSRKSLLPILYKNLSDFYEAPGEYNQYSPKTYLLLFWIFIKDIPDFDFEHKFYEEKEQELEEQVKNIGYDYNSNFCTYEDYSNFTTWFLSNLYSSDKHKCLIKNVESYYSKISNKDIIFDLGYSGRLQKAISEAAGCKLDVLYLIRDESRAELFENNSNINIKNFYDYTPALNNELREFIMSENAPGCIGFRQEDNDFIPVFSGKRDEYCTSKTILDIQRGAIDFIKDIYSIFKEDIDILPFKPQEVSLPFEGFFREIPETDVNIFDRCYQENFHTGKENDYSWKDYYKIVMGGFPKCKISVRGSLDDKIYSYCTNRKRIAFFGTGKICENILKKSYGIYPQVLLDNSVALNSSEYKYGIKTFNPKSVENLSDYFIVITTKYYSEISEQLIGQGLKQGKDFVWYKDLL